MSCAGCEELAARVTSLEEQNHELWREIADLKAKFGPDLPSPSLPPQEPFPPLSPPSTAIGLGTPALSISPQSPRSPGLGPTLLSKVSSRVHRMLKTDNGQSGGPVTVRRNSNTVRPRGLSVPDSPGGSRPDSRSNSRSSSPEPQANDPIPIVIPTQLRTGITFLRVTHNKKVNRVLKLDEHSGILYWQDKPSSRLSLDRICDIYTGEDARNYREMLKVSKDLENRWATIIHQRPGEQKVRALHLVVATKREFDILINAIQQLLNFRREMMSGLTRAGSHFVDIHWSRAAHNERISFDEFISLARQLHINCSRHFLLKVFTEADIDASGTLDFDEFKKTVEILSRREDLRAIYDSVKNNFGVLDRAAFDHFMIDVQMAPEKAEKSWHKYSVDGEISYKSFCDLITSTTTFPAVLTPKEDLDQPITSYWISSSHNTYLTGKQVGYGTNNSIEGYIRSLQSGCRCVEIDLWDGSNGPIVCHGSPVALLTNSLEFNDVVQAIRKYGFLTSPYPLILSLEVHLNHDNQLRVAGALKNILGDMLLTKPLSTPGFELPSPNELKHKVLVKVKSGGASESFSMGGSDSSADEAELPVGSIPSSRSGSVSNDVPPKPKNHKIIPELGELGVYLSAAKFSNFAMPEAKAVNHCFSFSERTVKTMLKNPSVKAQLIKHNTKYFARVYPSALKIRSGNFDPMTYWRLGFQMVALNWQTFDLGMQLNHAFHSPHIGYSLKPSWMHPSVQPMHASTNQYKFKITVISAQQLPRPKELKADAPLNPCVAIECYGLPSVIISKSTTISDNGFNPIWNYSSEFQLTDGDLDFVCVRFAVYNNQENLFAATTVKLKTLCAGYRHIPLQDCNGEDYLFSSLFIKTEISKK